MISYLDKWEEEANGTVGMKAEAKARLLLSKQTMHGWRMTGTFYVNNYNLSSCAYVVLHKHFRYLKGINFCGKYFCD